MSDDIFKECFRCNRDGFGVAWQANGEVHAIKGIMEVDKALEIYKTIPETTHICHFRIASIGGVCPELTHPFLVTEDSPSFENYRGSEAVLFHNGHFSDWKEVLMHCLFKTGKYPEGKLSDSRAMALGAAIAGFDLLNLIGGKIAVLTTTSVYIWDKSAWTENDEILHSNTTFRLPGNGTCTTGRYNHGLGIYDYEGYTSPYGGYRGRSTQKEEAEKPAVTVKQDGEWVSLTMEEYEKYRDKKNEEEAKETESGLKVSKQIQKLLLKKHNLEKRLEAERLEPKNKRIISYNIEQIKEELEEIKQAHSTIPVLLPGCSSIYRMSVGGYIGYWIRHRVD